MFRADADRVLSSAVLFLYHGLEGLSLSLSQYECDGDCLVPMIRMCGLIAWQADLLKFFSIPPSSLFHPLHLRDPEISKNKAQERRGNLSLLMKQWGPYETTRAYRNKRTRENYVVPGSHRISETNGRNNSNMVRRMYVLYWNKGERGHRTLRGKAKGD